MALVALMLIATDAMAERYQAVADVELRGSAPTVNRGGDSEIASRVATNRDSVIYLQFDVSSMTAAELANDITIRTTYRNNNLTIGRITDTVEPIGDNNGWDYFVLDPTMEGADWDEMTITPATAPGAATDYLSDGVTADCTTKMTGYTFYPTAGLTYIGQQLYDVDDIDGTHLPVGKAFDYTPTGDNLTALQNAIEVAQGTEHQTLTIVMGIASPYNSDNSQWVGFNYLFNPKEKLTLQTDSTSVYSGADNSDGYFAPALITPEPATLVLLGLGGLLLRRKK